MADRWLFTKDSTTNEWVPIHMPSLGQIQLAPSGSYLIQHNFYVRQKSQSGWSIVFNNYPKEIKAYALINSINLIEDLFIAPSTPTLH